MASSVAVLGRVGLELQSLTQSRDGLLELLLLKINQAQVRVYLGYSWFQVAQFFVGFLCLAVLPLSQGILPFLGVSLNLVGIGGLGGGIAAQKKEDERTPKELPPGQTMKASLP